MKKKNLDYFGSINCRNVCILAYYCCQTGIDVSRCVYLASMALNLEQTVGGQYYESLQNASPIIMWAEQMSLNHSKIEIVRQHLLNDMEN